MVVPLGFVPCQFQVSPEGGVPTMVSVFGPHVPDKIGVFGLEGIALTVTLAVEIEELQQPEE